MVVAQRALGASDIRVSVIGFGTVKLGRNEGVKYPHPFNIPDDRSVRALLQQARELGINLLDTAPAYGNAEERVGGLIRGARDQWVLCTKVGEEFVQGESQYNFTESYIHASVERSLTRLNTDRVDILLLHSDGQDEKIIMELGALATLQDIQRSGKARLVGISVKSLAGLRCALAHGADVVMATLNRDYRDELPGIQEAAAQGTGVLIKKALASGHGSPADLRDVAAEPGVSSVVIGTVNADHLHANCRAIGG